MQLGISLISEATHTTNPPLTSSGSRSTGFVEALQGSSSNDAPGKQSSVAPMQSSLPGKSVSASALKPESRDNVPLLAASQLQFVLLSEPGGGNRAAAPPGSRAIIQQSLLAIANTKATAGSCSGGKNLSALSKTAKANTKLDASKCAFMGESTAAAPSSALLQDLWPSLVLPGQLNTLIVRAAAAGPEGPVIQGTSSFDTNSTRADSQVNTIPEDPSLLSSVAGSCHRAQAVNRSTFELGDIEGAFQPFLTGGSRTNEAGPVAGHASASDNIVSSVATKPSPLFPTNTVSQTFPPHPGFSEPAMLMNAGPSDSPVPRADIDPYASPQGSDEVQKTGNEDMGNVGGNATKSSIVSPPSSPLTPAIEPGAVPIVDASSSISISVVMGTQDSHRIATASSSPPSQPDTVMPAQIMKPAPRDPSISTGVNAPSERLFSSQRASHDQSRAVSESMLGRILSDPNEGAVSKAHTTVKEARISASTPLTLTAEKLNNPAAQADQSAGETNLGDASLRADAVPEAGRDSTAAATTETGSPAATAVSPSDQKPAVNSNIVPVIGSAPVVSSGSVTPANSSLLAPPPAPTVSGTPEKAGPPAEILQPHQMLDTAPDGNPSSGALPPMAHLPANPSELQMQVGVHTSTFGDVQVHTQIEQSQVGISIRADHEFAHWFSPEVGGLENGLKSQHLNLTSIDFSSARSGAQSDPGSQHGQPHQSPSEKPAPRAASELIQINSDEPENKPEPVPVFPPRLESHVSVLV